MELKLKTEYISKYNIGDTPKGTIFILTNIILKEDYVLVAFKSKTKLKELNGKYSGYFTEETSVNNMIESLKEDFE